MPRHLPDRSRYAAAPTHRLIARFHAWTAAGQPHPLGLLAELDARGISISALEDDVVHDRAMTAADEMADDRSNYRDTMLIKQGELLPDGYTTRVHQRSLRAIALDPDAYNFL